jgi:hypothetical protein
MHKPGSIFEAASQILFSEAKSSGSKALDAIAKLAPGHYPKKSDILAVYKKFPIDDEIIDNGDGTFSHPESALKASTRIKMTKMVSRLRKASVE